MLLFSFMVAAGMLTGEAFFGVEAAILAVSDELEIEQEYLPDSWTEDTYLDEMLGAEDDDFTHVLGYAISRITSDIDDGKEPSCEILPDSVICTETMSIKSWWPQARFAGFLLVNLALGALIYVLFKAAGIIGIQEESEDESEVMDAELAD